MKYHPLIVNDPWQAPDDLSVRIDDLLAETKTLLVQRAQNPWDQYDANKARAQLEEIKHAMNLSLTRIYKVHVECVSCSAKVSHPAGG